MTELPINQIIQGDCLEVMRGWPDKCVDAVITDPPYGIDLQPQRGRTEAIVNDRPDEARELWGAVIPECFRVLKDNTASLFFGRWSEVWAKELLDKYFTVKGCIVWKKNVWGIGYYLRPQWELAWYIHKGKPPVPDAAISDVWEFDREPAPIHSCQKPLHLLTHAVNFCGGDIILDPFAGSGTTLVAAKQLGRKYIGIEIEPKYVAICKERLKQEQLAL